jgi:hypothetical protein
MPSDYLLILDGVPGESASAGPAPGWLLELHRERLLPPGAIWYGHAGSAAGPALNLLRRAGWNGTPSRNAPLPPGFAVPLLLLHGGVPEHRLTPLLARAAQQVAWDKTQELRRRPASGVNVIFSDGSVRCLLIGLLLPAVQKVREAANRLPARYPFHLHGMSSAAPGAQARQSTLVVEL